MQEYKNIEYRKDGLIIIDKTCFANPEIRQKIKKMPSGRKKRILKKIKVTVDYGKMIEDGRIEVQNCSNCWKKYVEKDIDIMACRILFKLFNQYQEYDKIPENISIFT